MGWTRAFHNTGWPYSSILRSTYLVWIHRKLAGALVGYEPISRTTLVVRLKAKPRNIQVYGQQLRMKKWRGSTKTCLKQSKKSPRDACNGRL